MGLFVSTTKERAPSCAQGNDVKCLYNRISCKSKCRDADDRKTLPDTGAPYPGELVRIQLSVTSSAYGLSMEIKTFWGSDEATQSA